MSPVIKIENIYKEYRLGTIGYGTLREDMVSWWAKIKGRTDPNSIIGQSNGKIISSTDHILALNNINLEVTRGEIVGIIGKSGAGKSSLIRCVNLLTLPDQGQVIVNNEDLMTLNPKKLRSARKNIGMVFQHFNLLSAKTIFENIALPLKLIHSPKADIKKRAEMRSLAIKSIKFAINNNVYY